MSYRAHERGAPGGIGGLLLLAVACLPKVELAPGEATPDAGAGVGESTTTDGPCGGDAEQCCLPPARACRRGLGCDTSTQRCGPLPVRLCEADDDCERERKCCAAGLLGTCSDVELVCPAPDLTVLPTTFSQLRAFVDERRFDPATATTEEGAQAMECAIARGCVREPGIRRLLHFSTQVSNVGAADLLLGSPASTPGFDEPVCGGERSFEDFLVFELRDAAGNQASEGRARFHCSPAPEGFLTRFDCSFQGIAHGFAEPYEPDTGPLGAAGMDCQWLDITGLAPGEYRLGIQVNPERRLNEVDFTNNRIDVPVTLRSFNPVVPCIEVVDDPLAGTRGQECGWSMTSPVEGARCDPGSPVELTCPGCTGDPMARICEGTTPCSAGTALASASDTVLQADGQLVGVCDLSSCNYVDYCPYAAFTCPPSGVYSWLVAHEFDPTLPLPTCDLRERE